MSTRHHIYLPGNAKAIVLSDTNHMATGGEGSVYRKDQLVYKLYLDPAKALARKIPDKVALLSKMGHPGVVVPSSVVVDSKGVFKGIAMPYAQGDALCSLYTNTGRDKLRIGDKETGDIVSAMREVMQHVHQHQGLMVDANELNWLVRGTQPIAIDSDSWQLPGFPATAIMASIRDYHMDPSKGFTEGSDWFSWAVVTFPLWTGIHPFKGTHPTFGRGNMEERMRAHASVFDAGVKLPPAARGLTPIPRALKDWYARVFGSMDRTAPPPVFGAANPLAVGVTHKTVAPRSPGSHGAFTLTKLTGPAAGTLLPTEHGFVLGKTSQGWDIYDVQSNPVKRLTPPPAWCQAVGRSQAGLLRVGTLLLAAYLENGMLEVLDLEHGTKAQLATHATRVWQSRNRLFVQLDDTDQGLHEVQVTSFGAGLVLGVKQQWNVWTQSTQFFRHVYVKDMFGLPVLGVSTAEGFVQGTCPGLRGYKVAQGFAVDPEHVWLSATRVRDGESVRLTAAYQQGGYKILEEVTVDTLDLDAASNEQGVGILRSGDSLTVVKGPHQKVVPCPASLDDIRLLSLQGRIGGVWRGEVYWVAMG